MFKTVIRNTKMKKPKIGKKCKRGKKLCKNPLCEENIPIHAYICSFCNFINEKKNKSNEEELKEVLEIYSVYI